MARVLSWLVLLIGTLLGTVSSLAVLRTLIEDPSSPNMGWGAVGILFLQPLAALVALLGALFVVKTTPAGSRRNTMAVVGLALAWVGFGFVGLLFHNSGC